MSHPVLCHAHVRARVARDRAAGLKVYDDRGEFVTARRRSSGYLLPVPGRVTDANGPAAIATLRADERSHIAKRAPFPWEQEHSDAGRLPLSWQVATRGLLRLHR
jgi:hypothetical protein